MSNQEVTLDEVIKAMKKTEELIRKLRIQQMNPGLPLHLAPKGKKSKKSRTRTSSKPKARTRTSSKPKARTRTSSKPKARTRISSKPKARTRTSSKPKARTRTSSKPKAKPKSMTDIQLKKKQIEELGVDARQLFGLDNDELDAILENSQLIKSMAPYRESFLPPDDSPRHTPPPGFNNYPPQDNPNDPARLKRNDALARPGDIDQEPLPRPRFG